MGCAKILLTGSTGQLGFELRRSLSMLGEITATDRARCNLADPGAIAAVLERERPDIIVNAAAYTAVDRAEVEHKLAYAVNSDAPRVLAGWAASNGALLVHYSTDYVFDGTLDRPYREDDAPNPLSVYGRSKLAGEEAIRASGCKQLIFRTSWVYGAYGDNFLKTMLRLMRERDELRIIDDQFGAPTSASLVADVSAFAIRQVCKSSGMKAPARERDVREADLYGTYHLAASGETTWYGYASEIARLFGLQNNTRLRGACALLPVHSCDYLQMAPRPTNSRLNTGKLQKAFNLQLPSWSHGVELVSAMLAQQCSSAGKDAL